MTTKAKDFTLPNQLGESVTLSEVLKTHKVVLYFYPKDMTPGCTMEGIGFSQRQAQFEKVGVKVFGVSADSVKSHEKFCEKEKLGIDLLADEKSEVIKSFGVWQEKSMFGKKYMGISRESFLIGRDGEIIKHWKTVKPTEHPQQVLEFVQSQ